MKHILLITILVVASFVGLNANEVTTENLILPTIKQVQASSAPNFLNGEIVVKLNLDETGKVESIKGYEGDFFLKSYAEEAVAELLVFTPTYKNGEPIPSTVKLPLIF